MGLIKPTRILDDFLETEVTPEDIEKIKEKPYIWLVRPCYRYKELYDDCAGIKARFQQYYIFGHKLDCTNHKNNYNLCREFQRKKDANLLDPIINSELDRIKERTQSIYNNKIWELRTCPPADFGAPLPEFIAKRSSEFPKYEEERQKMKTNKINIFQGLVEFIENTIKK